MLGTHEEATAKTLRDLSIGFVLACELPAVVHSQVPPPNEHTLDAVVREIRLLRQAVERQSATTAKVQLVVARLSLQDQRVARARQTLERLESEAAAIQREQGHMQDSARTIAQMIEQATDEERHKQLQSEHDGVRARLASHQVELVRTEARLVQAREALDNEAGRYDEIEAGLRDLDRQLQGGQ